MTVLEKIEQRLTLFKEYLQFRTSNWYLYLPYWKIKTYFETGNLFYHYEESGCPDFDQWLIKNGHEDLIL